MRRLGVLLASLCLSAPVPAQGAPAAVVPTGQGLAGLANYRYTLVGMRPDPAAENLLGARGATIVAPELHIWPLRSDVAQRPIPRLRRSGSIRYAEPDRPVYDTGHLDGGDPLVAATVRWALC